MDAIADPAIREIWCMKSAQVGWTEILNNVIGYFVHQDAAPMLLVQPTLEMAEAWSKDRLAPMIRDTPALRDRIADARSRDSGNTLLHKKFAGGHLTVAGANSPAGLASRPIRIVLFDEVDRFPSSAGAEGDPVSLGKKRSTTFWNRKMLAGSTPTIKGSSRIESGFEGSDQRYYFVPCPHCDEFQRLIWPQVRWPDDRPSEAVYVCQHCGAEIAEADKAEMLRRGEWRASKPTRDIAGFHISELYSPWSTWGDMAASFLKAKRLPETLQTWINTSLGETWEEKGDTVDSAGLSTRRESYTTNSLPPGVLMVTAGTDVQDDRLETTVWGWGAEEEAWRVEHIVLRGDPASAQLWADHDEILRRRYRTDDGRELVIEACAIDSGGHFTEQVYRYANARKRFRVWAVKGIGGAGRLAWPKKSTRSARHRIELWPIGVDTIKDIIYGRLRKVTEPGPGYLHFDAGTEEDWLEQLTSETVVFRVVQGRRVRQWKPRRTGVRQEALDCTVYAYAAFVGRGGVKLIQTRRSGPVATGENLNPEAPSPAQEAPKVDPPPPARRKQLVRQQGWMSRFRG
jgi:phage terminase large subunit GpA-like protein